MRKLGYLVRLLSALVLLCVAMPVTAGEAGAPEPTPDEAVAGMEAECAAAAEAMAARQAEKSLYDRLGGSEAIRAVVEDVVQRHLVNEQIKHFLDGVDLENLADQVATFLIAGSGGDSVYTGRSMRDAHAHLHLTNADFLAAGGDIVAALEAAGVGPEERQEVVCTLVAHRAEVVMR